MRFEVTSDDKLKILSDELSRGLHNLSSSPKSTIDDEISALWSEAQSRSYPLIEFSLLLFRKYADVANTVRDAHKSRKAESNHGLLTGNFDGIESDDENPSMIGGLHATKQKSFNIRGAILIFSFLSFVIVSSAPHINHAFLTPDDILDPYCSDELGETDGYFDFRAYEFLMVVAVLVYFKNTSLLIYYLLPVDEDQHKFVPGLKALLLHCLSDDQVKYIFHRVGLIVTSCTLFAQMVVDLFFTFLTTVACLSASIMLDKGTSIKTSLTTIYVSYTLDTFYGTYSNVGPCLGTNPAPTIRGGLAMMYIALFFLVLISYVSTRKWYADFKTRANDSGVSSLPLAQEDTLSRHGSPADEVTV